MKLYDTSYSKCPCFWGTEPAGIVKKAVELTLIDSRDKKLRAIDFGCGEGKNVAFIANNGISVVGVDQSSLAIEHAITLYSDLNASFLICDMLQVDGASNSVDLVVSTGSLHCLSSEAEVIQMIEKMYRLAKPGGYIAISSFNNRANDFSGHDAYFNPILLPHDFYLYQLRSLEIISSSDEVLVDVHPDNNIRHSHTITRILARKRQ